MELSKEYINGFNNGYLIRKHKPILMKTLEEGLKGNTPFVQGLKDGNQQYEQELNRQLVKQHQKSIAKNKDLGLGL